MPRLRSRAALCACALLFAPVLTGCGAGQSVQTIVAHKIADALPGAIGPAAHYDVQVSGDALSLARGRARHIHIVGQDVQMTPTVVLDTLTLDAEDVSFNAQLKRVDTIKNTSFAATMSSPHLNAYLAQARPDLGVTFGENDLGTTLPVSAGPIHTTVTVFGTLAPTVPGANTIDFIADRARLGRLPVPAFAVNAALESINPVLDLSRVRVPIAVQSVTVEGGMLTLRGTAQVENLSQGP